MTEDKEYTYWFFFLDKTEDSVLIKSELYAYTDNKRLAKIFEEDRDMTLLRKVKRKISRRTVNELAANYQGQILKERKILTYDMARDIKINGTMVVTTNEDLLITNVGIEFLTVDIFNYCQCNPDVFNEEIIDALKELEYVNIYRYLNNYDGYDYDKVFNKIIPDDLGIFLRHYGKTVSK